MKQAILKGNLQKDAAHGLVCNTYKVERQIFSFQHSFQRRVRIIDESGKVSQKKINR